MEDSLAWMRTLASRISCKVTDERNWTHFDDSNRTMVFQSNSNGSFTLLVVHEYMSLVSSYGWFSIPWDELAIKVKS